jgi:hypothetical protein
MPAQPSWFPRLPQIWHELRALETVPFLDRQAFERLFRVKDRRARVLMSRFPGVRRSATPGSSTGGNSSPALEGLQQGESFSGNSSAGNDGRRLRASETRAPGPPSRDT